MPLIALVDLNNCIEACYECSGHRIISSISDWDEVTDAELKALQRYSPHRVIVRVDTKTALYKVRVAVAHAEKQKKAEEARLEAARLKREEKKKQKELLGKQKNEAEAKKLYEQLKERFECR